MLHRFGFERILVLDDDYSVHANVKALAGDLLVEHFITPGEFLYFLRATDFDVSKTVAFVDIGLGEGQDDGFVVMEVLKDLEFELPVVFISCSELRADQQRAREHGAYAYLSKLGLERDKGEFDRVLAEARGAHLRAVADKGNQIRRWGLQGLQALIVAVSAEHEIKQIWFRLSVQRDTVLNLTRDLLLHDNARADQIAQLSGGIRTLVDDVNMVLLKLDETYSLIRENKIIVNWEQFDLVSLSNDIVRSHVASGSRLVVEVIGPENLVVNADKRKISEIISNLIDNGVKYASEGKRLELFLSIKENDDVEVAVRDYGTTVLSFRDLRRIWNPYERAAANKEIEGKGLGLAIVKLYAELHGGQPFHRAPSAEIGNIFGVRIKADAS